MAVSLVLLVTCIAELPAPRQDGVPLCRPGSTRPSPARKFLSWHLQYAGTTRRLRISKSLGAGLDVLFRLIALRRDLYFKCWRACLTASCGSSTVTVVAAAVSKKQNGWVENWPLKGSHADSFYEGALLEPEPSGNRLPNATPPEIASETKHLPVEFSPLNLDSGTTLGVSGTAKACFNCYTGLLKLFGPFGSHAFVDRGKSSSSSPSATTSTTRTIFHRCQGAMSA